SGRITCCSGASRATGSDRKPGGRQFDALGPPRLRGYMAAADTDGIMQSRDHGRTRPRRVGFVIALSLLASCSPYHGLFAARPATAAGGPAAATTSASSAAVGQRFALFGFGEGDKTAPAAAPTEPPEPPELDCPGVEIRQGASTFQQSAPDN